MQSQEVSQRVKPGSIGSSPVSLNWVISAAVVHGARQKGLTQAVVQLHHNPLIGVIMICDQCRSHMHRDISILQGKTVNMLAYGCDGGECDYSLRKRLEEYTNEQVQKYREERNKQYLIDKPKTPGS